jgi:hypothetical protein
MVGISRGTGLATVALCAMMGLTEVKGEARLV